MSERTIECAVLGATGLVGQEFLRLLACHPWFRPVALAASDASRGQKLGERLPGIELPEALLEREIVSPEDVLRDPPPLIFSALPAATAGALEAELASRGAHVFSNAASHRGDPDVPVLIPEVNPDHLGAIARQRRERGWSGTLVTNPNCSTVGLVLGLSPWLARFGARRLDVSTWQALSGAGLPGVPALAIQGNVIPHIVDEESKIERETARILGRWDGTAFQRWPARVRASCVRVPVAHGHLISAHVELGAAVSEADLHAAIAEYRPAYGDLDLPSAPPRAVLADARPDAPQPARDLDAMAVRVGRIRHDGECTRAFLLCHNLIRGSAGGSVLNAELALALGVM